MEQSKLKIWLSSARPKTLWAAVAPVAVGAAMAYGDGFVHVPSLILTVMAAVLIQIGTNFANDYYDFIKGADTETRTGPVRATQAGLVSPSQMKLAFIITFAIAVLLGFFLVLRGGMPILIIGIASVICGILYTAGPFPLAYLGLGEIFVLIFFGPVAVGGTYYLQTASINSNVIVAGLAPGLLACAILVVNNFRDYETDKAADKKTLVVKFGLSFGIAEYVICIAVACLVPVYLCMSTASHYYCLIALLTVPMGMVAVKAICSKPDAYTLNSLLAQTARLMIIFSILFSAGWVI